MRNPLILAQLCTIRKVFVRTNGFPGPPLLSLVLQNHPYLRLICIDTVDLRIESP